MRDRHQQLVSAALRRRGVKKAYEALEDEFNLLSTLVHARHIAGKTQSELAQAMGTTTSVIGRLESAGGKQHHSPTWSTLCRYANALGYKLKIKLISINRV